MFIRNELRINHSDICSKTFSVCSIKRSFYLFAYFHFFNRKCSLKKFVKRDIKFVYLQPSLRFEQSIYFIVVLHRKNVPFELVELSLKNILITYS